MSYQTWACLVVISAYCHLVSFNTHLSFTLLIILFLTYIFFPFWDWFVFGLGNWLELVGVLPSFRSHYLGGSLFILELIPKLDCFINKIICFEGHYKYNNSSYREDVKVIYIIPKFLMGKPIQAITTVHRQSLWKTEKSNNNKCLFLRKKS